MAISSLCLPKQGTVTLHLGRKLEPSTAPSLLTCTMAAQPSLCGNTPSMNVWG